MIIWNIEKLKQNIAANKLTEKDYFGYYLISAVLTIGTYYIPNNLNSISNYALMLKFILYIIYIIGLIFCFKIHSYLKLDRFVEKFISLSMVSLTRYLAFFVLILITYILTLSVLHAIGGNTADFLIGCLKQENLVLFSEGYIHLYTFYICYHFRDLCYRSHRAKAL